MFLKNKEKQSLGFTLIELLVVIAIIAILATAIMVSLRGARESAEDTNRMTAITQLRNFAYIDFRDLESSELSDIGGSVGQIICEYGKPEDTNTSEFPNCRSEGVLSIYFDQGEEQMCATIQLNEIGVDGENRYFCIDRDLTARKYDAADHKCTDNNFHCSQDL